MNAQIPMKQKFQIDNCVFTNSFTSFGTYKISIKHNKIFLKTFSFYILSEFESIK